MFSRKEIFAAVVIAAALFVSCKNPQSNTEPLPASVFYDFDVSLDGWESNGISNETLSYNTDANFIKTGAGSVKCSVTLSYADTTPKIGLLYQNFVSNQNLSNRTVTIWVYVPATLAATNPGYYLNLNVKRQSMGINIDTFYGIGLGTAGWNKVTYEIPAYSTDAGNVTHDYSDVQMMYFAVEKSYQTPANWTGDIYFDELSW